MSLLSLSPEARLLYLAAGPAENDERIRELPLEELNWPLVFGLATRAKAITPLWERLQQIGGERIPAHVRGRLQQLAMVAEFRQAHLEQRFLEVTDLLSSRGIDVLLLKGAALAVSAYGSFQARAMGDLDLLVQPERAAEAQQLLLEAGWPLEFAPDSQTVHATSRAEFYAGHHHLPALVDPSGTGLAVEFHTALFPPGHPFRLPTEPLWDASLEVTYRGRTMRVPHPAHQVLHLCVHFAWSHMMRSGGWRTFRDLRAITLQPSFDWDELLRLAQDARAVTCCYWTLKFARDLAAVAVPDGLVHHLRPRLPAPLLRRLERHLVHEMLPSDSMCPSVRLREKAWELAIRPARSGHGASRPWIHASEPAEGAPADFATESRQLRRHLQRAQRWRAYLRALRAPPGHSSPTGTRRTAVPA